MGFKLTSPNILLSTLINSSWFLKASFQVNIRSLTYHKIKSQHSKDTKNKNNILKMMVREIQTVVQYPIESHENYKVNILLLLPELDKYIASPK